MKVTVTEKLDSGIMREVDQREWSQEMLVSLNNANYLLVNGNEYEMIEGRLNVNQGAIELLVVAVKDSQSRS